MSNEELSYDELYDQLDSTQELLAEVTEDKRQLEVALRGTKELLDGVVSEADILDDKKNELSGVVEDLIQENESLEKQLTNAEGALEELETQLKDAEDKFANAADQNIDTNAEYNALVDQRDDLNHKLFVTQEELKYFKARCESFETQNKAYEVALNQARHETDCVIAQLKQKHDEVLHVTQTENDRSLDQQQIIALKRELAALRNARNSPNEVADNDRAVKAIGVVIALVVLLGGGYFAKSGVSYLWNRLHNKTTNTSSQIQ